MEHKPPGTLRGPFELYLSRYAQLPDTSHPPVPDDLGISVVIPSYKEELLLSALESLHQCNLPACSTEVIVVINHPENASSIEKELSHQSYALALQWANSHSTNKFRFIIVKVFDLPQRHAGVGLARKLGMDLAVHRFNTINNKEGVIACFDADCTCERNYLTELHRYFTGAPKKNGCSIHYEHSFEMLEGRSREIIVFYELHLRYLVLANRWIGFPYAHHTVGSSMAVNVDAYQKQGGMNRRKAGEDFHFIHKIIPLGGFHFLSTTSIYPSARISDRVPFGTGRFMMDRSNESSSQIKTYNPESYRILRRSFQLMLDRAHNENYELPKFDKEFEAFVLAINGKEKLLELLLNSKGIASFEKSFFHWFNAFMIIRFLHFSRDHFHPNVPVMDGIKSICKWLSIEEAITTSEQALVALRLYEKANPN